MAGSPSLRDTWAHNRALNMDYEKGDESLLYKDARTGLIAAKLGAINPMLLSGACAGMQLALHIRQGVSFRVAGNLIRRLNNTEMRGIVGTPIHLPFPVCAFRMAEQSTLYLCEKDIFLDYSRVNPFNNPNLNPILVFLLRGAGDWGTFSLPCVVPDGDFKSEEDIVKLLLYLASTDVRREVKYYDQSVPDLLAKRDAARSKTQRKRINQILSTKNRRTYTYIGGGLPPLKQTVSAKGVPLAVRTLVRGHFRNQPCGVGRSDSKLIWIQPFWRGPLDGEISNKEKRVT